MADIIISGYHGFANSGDEALLFAILQSLKAKRPELDITVLSKTPQDTAREYGVRSVPRFNLFKVAREMKNTKMLLFGGGSLLQDVTSRKSLLYYLTVIRMAQKRKLKIMLYANGIGPIEKKLDRWLAKRILNRVDIITLRDDRSDEELKRLEVTKPFVEITADPTFTIDANVSLSGKYYTSRAGVAGDKRLCIVSIRRWKHARADFTDQMASLCDYMVEKHGMYPLFVPFQYPQDLDISRAVMEKMQHESYIINRELTVAEMFSVLSEGEIIVGMRLHSLIYATTLKIPAMALVYDPKVSAFMESLSQPDWIDVAAFDAEDAMAVFDKMVESADAKKEALRRANALLREKAEKNADYAIGLLEGDAGALHPDPA